jgi:hypothetical protein
MRFTILRGRVSDMYFRVSVDVGPSRQHRLIDGPKTFAGHPPPPDSMDHSDDTECDPELESILSNMADFQDCFRRSMNQCDMIDSPPSHRKPRILHLSLRLMLHQSSWRPA